MKQHKKIRLKLPSKFLQIILFAFTFRIFFAFWTWHPDVNNHIDWGIRFFEYLPAGFYAPEANVWSYTWPNQPPGSMYMFAAIKILFDFIFNIFWQINVNISFFPSLVITFFEAKLYGALLQFPAIFADFGIAYLIYKITKSKLASLIFLLNPVIWYNSSVWGQYDSVISFLFLLGFYFIKNKKIFFSILAIALSLYIKISLVVLLPVYAIYLLKNVNIKNILKNSILVLIIILVVTLPFSSSSNPLTWLYKLYTERVLTDQLHLITANAFNFWGFAKGVAWVPNSLPLLGKTYEFWGYVLFIIFSIPVYLKAFKSKNINIILFSLGLIYFTAWMFLTNMHERYLYPFFVFSLPALIIYKQNVKYYLALSILSLINMYYLWYVPKFPILESLVNSANKQLISFVILIIFIKIYRDFFRLTSINKV